MKLGIIGSGLIVQEFLPRLVQIEGLEVLGIQGIKEEFEIVQKLCKENNVKLATYDFDEICTCGIDTAYVAVPNYLHFDYCKKLLEKGLNVIVEKPMTSNFAEASELARIAIEKKLFLFEAVTTLYLSNYIKIQEWLPRIGEVKVVQSHYSQYSRRYDSFRKGETLPVFDPNKSGGALMDLNLYNMHFVNGLFGKTDQIKYYANIERNIDTSGCLIMEYPNFIAVCIAAKDSKGEAGALIQGTEGCIKSSHSANIIGTVQLELNNGTVERVENSSFRERLIPEFKAFIKAINECDWEFNLKQIQRSLDVSEMQTIARYEAGIVFPADNK